MFEWVKKTWGKIKDKIQGYFSTNPTTTTQVPTKQSISPAVKASDVQKKDIKQTVTKAQNLASALNTGSQALKEAAQKVDEPTVGLKTEIKKLDVDIAKKRAALKERLKESTGTEKQKKEKLKPFAREIIILNRQKRAMEARLEKMMAIQEKLHSGAKTYAKTANRLSNMATELVQRQGDGNLTPSPTPKIQGPDKSRGRQ